MHQNFGGKLDCEDRLEDTALDRMIILRWLLRKGRVDWIQVAQHRFQLRPLVNTVTNLVVS
jgi:hypothetical protein